MTGWIGIALGDVTGIGPEVTLKALAEETANDGTRYLLLGDAHYIASAQKALGSGISFQPFTSYSAAGRFFSFNPMPAPLAPELPPGAPEAARAAVAWLTEGGRRCLRHELDALVTAPLNKHAVVRSGQAFVGQTEFLSHLAGTEQTIMMLLGRMSRGAGCASPWPRPICP